eukprot:TRINITY_DN2556_c0_g1_i1.p1 TRINITY_DN2556_c0_g1~~TRINITY_DN2556_c0_g1_i1.p1  ORF type:complete len:169 (-),score=54.48 TRINITY_DN2556_c0_g1_i1:198-668(-)
MLRCGKRSFDAMNQELEGASPPRTCSPKKIEFLRAPRKAARTAIDQDSATSSASSPPRDSIFVASRSAEFDRMVHQILHKTITKNTRRGQNGDHVLTASDALQLINTAVSVREKQLEEEFTTLLQEKLQEQFRAFSKFNEDYISTRIKDSDFSYMS